MQGRVHEGRTRRHAGSQRMATPLGRGWQPGRRSSSVTLHDHPMVCTNHSGRWREPTFVPMTSSSLFPTSTPRAVARTSASDRSPACCSVSCWNASTRGTPVAWIHASVAAAAVAAWCVCAAAALTPRCCAGGPTRRGRRVGSTMMDGCAAACDPVQLAKSLCAASWAAGVRRWPPRRMALVALPGSDPPAPRQDLL